MPGGVLVLAPDEVRLRQARRMLAGTSFPVFLALERDAPLAGLDSPVWRPPSIASVLDLRYVLSHLDLGGGLPEEAQPARTALPVDIALDAPVPLAAARAAETRREARPGPALRLALGLQAGPVRADGSFGAAGVAVDR